MGGYHIYLDTNYLCLSHRMTQSSLYLIAALTSSIVTAVTNVVTTEFEPTVQGW